MIIRRTQNEKGASIAEAAAGLVVLIPIVLIIIDISALVLAQTANDDLAKHAARAAATQSTPQLRQAAATSVVNNYPGGSMTSAPTLVAYSESAGNGQQAQQVTVRTSIVCNLPVQVPFGGPTSQQFVAFDTEPVISGLATASNGASAPATSSSQAWGQQDDLGYVNVHLQTGPGGNPQAIGPLIPNVGEFSGGGTSTTGNFNNGNGSNNNSSSGSSSSSGNANGSGSSDFNVGGTKQHGGKGGGSSSSGSGSSSSSSSSSSSGGPT